MSKSEEKLLKTVKVKGGGDYVMVNTRTLEFHDLYPNGKIETKIIDRNDHLVIMESVVTPDVSNPERTFNGIACEVQGQGDVNDFSHIENCETSARGRALGGLGIGIKESMASFEEVANAKLAQAEKKAISEMGLVMQKFNKIFTWASAWLPMAVELKLTDGDAFASSLKKVFEQKRVSDAQNLVDRMDQKLLTLHSALVASEEYQDRMEQLKRKVGDTDQSTSDKEGGNT